MSDVLAFGVAFLAASISFGLFVGSLLSSSEVASTTVFFSSLPLVFSAGFIWPLESFPSVIYYLSLLVPSTPAINALVGLNQLGADVSMVIDSYAILWLQTLVYLSLAYIIFSRKRNFLYQNGEQEELAESVEIS